MREMQALVRNYVLNRDRQMKYLAVLIALSLFVSFMVPFILMQPADSMAEASACGIEEHVHTEEAGCYQLFCAPEEGEEHVHSERCYALICEKIVHTHTPNCYPTKPDFSALFSTIYDPENLKATADGKSYANSPNDKPSEYKAPAGSILGVATHFHIFAESVSLQSHVHGNIATNWLLQNGAFGVYNDRLNGMSSINYIRNLGPNGNLDNAYQTQLIMGSDYSSPPSPWFSNRYEIRSKKDRKTYYIPKDKFPMWFAPEYVVPQVKFEKKDRPFINITQELNKFAEMSMDLVEEAGAMNNDLGVSTKYPTVKSDQNGNFNGQSTTTPGTVVLQTQGENLTLDFSNIDDKYIYYTIDATNFDMVSPWSSWMKVLQIKGITEDKFLFLNIDVGTNPDAYFSKSWMVYKDDGTTFGTGEVPLEDGGCRVLYNIVSSDGNGGNYKPFEGKAVFGERRNGSILAPNADVNVAGNTNGTIIARNFVATGESHRCDIQQEGTEGDDADWSLGEDTPKPPQPKKIEITVQKEWSGQQLGQVKVYLYKSTTPNLDVATANLGTPHKEATLSSGNSWQTVFTDLPAEEAGKTLYYYVKEETLNNYTATYDKNGLSGNNGTVKITNVEQVQNITVSVEKKWDHPSGSSTSDITVILYKSSNPNLDATKPDQFTGNDATVAGTATLNSSNNWNATFNNLPAKENGNTLYYYIVEQNVPENYTVSYTGNGVNSANGKVTVTNAKGKMVSVTAKKQWKPSVPSNAIPVKVKLYQSKDSGLDATKPEQFSGMKEIDSATLSASNNWTYKFKEYPAANAKGEMYYYYIVESPVQSGYSAIYTNNGLSFNDGEIVVTNVKDITVTAKKIWDPDTVASTPTTQEPKTYKIMPIGDSITQGELGGADGSVGGGGAHGGYRKYLDYILEEKYEEFFGKDKTYNIDLVGPKNNVNPFDGNGAADEITATFSFNGTNVTYTYDNNHGGYSAHQSYTDDGNNSVYHQLVNADNNGNSGSIKAAQPDIVLLMIGTNDRNVGTSGVPVDEYEQRLHKLLDYMLEELPKESVIFLASIPEFEWYGAYKDVTEYNNKIKRVVQSYANSGKNVRFVDMYPLIKLADLSDKIHPSEAGYEKMGKNWATVIDSYIQELQPVSSVPAETRKPINVRLYKSQYGNLDATNADHVTQMQEVASATLNSDNGWTGKFESLPAMENGSTLYYYIVEKDVPKHYTVTYSNNAVNNNDGTVVVTNTKEKMLNITLDKEWVGGKPDNDSITVTLYQSTERNLDMTMSNAEFDSFVKNNEDKIWVYSDEKDTGKSTVTFTAGETPHFTNLPVYDADGKMYYYYVRESDVSGYKPSYSKNPVYGADKVVTITNTKMISVSVTKNWQITTNLSTTPIEVVIYKYKHIPAEGEMSYWPTTYLPAAATPIKLADGETDWTQWINGNGTVEFKNLPVEEDGYKLFYYIVEKENAEVTKNFDIIYGPDTTGQLVDFNQPDTYDKTITNKEKAATEISITVNKDWDVEDFFYDFDKDGTMDPPNDYYVQDSVNPVEQWADPIKVTLQYSTDGTNWTDYERYKDVEFYTTYTFTNLPKTTGADNTGSPYYYRVVESYNYGYVTEYKYPGGKSNINASEIQKGQAMPEVELKNTLLKRTLNVKKNWYNNINDGVDKVVVEIYRRTSTKKPDLGINPDGTISGGNGGNTGGDTPETFTPVEVLKTTFDANDTTKDGWTVHGNTQSSQGTAGINNDGYTLYCGDANDLSYISYTLDVVPGATYSFSTMTNRAKYTVLKVDYGNGTLEKVAEGDANAEDWVSNKVEGTFTVPDGVTSVTLQVGLNSAASYGPRFDDITVTQLTAGTPVTPKPYINSFDNNTTEGWTQDGNHAAGENKSGLQTNPTYDGSAYSYGLVSTRGKTEEVSNLSGYYYCDFIQKEFTDLTAGSTYNFSTMMTRTSGGALDVALRAVYNNGTPVEIARGQTTANATDWKKLAGEFTVPAGTTSVKLQIVPISNSGDLYTMLYVDDVKVDLVSSGNNGNTGTDVTTVTYDFEDGTVQGWSGLSGWANPPVSWGGHNDALSLHAGGSIYHNLDSSDFPAGHSYDFSAYVWKNGNAVNASLELHYDNAAGSPVTIATKENANGDKLEGRATIPAGATNVKLVLNVTGSDQFLADDITITGPYPSSNSKPRNVETFFSGSNTLTKRQLNIEKLDSNKLAKAEADADTSFWMDYEFPYRDMSANGGDAIVQFSDFREGALVGKTVRGIEIEFMTNGYSVPNNANMWFSTATYSSWGGGGSKGDDRIYVFESDHVIKDNDSLTIRTHVPEMIKRVRLSFSDGCTLTINNIKSLTEAMHTISGNYSKDVTLKNGGEWVGAWDINDTATELSYRWAGKKITSADVYFEKGYTSQNDLETDRNTIANTTGNPSGVEITKYGMYLLINGTGTKVGNEATSCNWNDKEVRAQGLSFNTNDANYDIATFNFNNCPTIEDPKQTQVTENNVTTITKDYLSTVIMKVADATKVKAVVLKCENGETFVLNNTQYTTNQTTESKRVYHDFAGSTSFSLSGWDEEQIVGVDVYRKKGTTDNSFSFNNDNNSISYYQTSNNDNMSFNSVLDVVKYTLNNPTTISKLNVNTGNPYAIEKLVLVGKSGAKYVVANTAYANGVGNYQKWYPFEYSGNTAPRYNNMILSVDQLGRDMGGRKISKVQIYMNRTAIPTNESTGQNATNTFLQDPNAPVYPDENVQNPSAWEGRLSNKGRNGDSNEECTVVGGRKGLCDIHEYTILTDGPYQYDGIANAKFNGDLNTTNPWTGDALNIWTNNPEDISRVVVQFEDGTSYTVWNMYYVASSKLEYGHETSFTANGKTDLFTGATNIHRYNARTLDHIVVTYGENGERFASIPQDLLQYGAQESDKENISIGEISITHTFAELINKQAVLKINDEDDDFTLANIKEIKLFYDDGYGSTYTITNTDYSPKAPADTPAIGNQPALGSDFVFISTLDLTKENNWQAALKGLPVTDGQGNAYEYVIVEKNVYGEGADRYQLVSYEHPDGVILEKDGTQTSFLNTTTDEENGLVIMPSSGGEGKTWFYVAGVALMLCGIAGCYGMKRRQRSRR